MQSIAGHIGSSKEMKKFNRKYKCISLKKTFDVLNYQFLEDEFVFVSLWAADADIGHAVCICKNLIFDSNCPHAMNLSKETLDVSCNGEFCKIHTGYLFHSWYTEKQVIRDKLLMAR